jgi:hypothetical protein
VPAALRCLPCTVQRTCSCGCAATLVPPLASTGTSEVDVCAGERVNQAVIGASSSSSLSSSDTITRRRREGRVGGDRGDVELADTLALFEPRTLFFFLNPRTTSSEIWPFGWKNCFFPIDRQLSASRRGQRLNVAQINMAREGNENTESSTVVAGLNLVRSSQTYHRKTYAPTSLLSHNSLSFCFSPPF